LRALGSVQGRNDGDDKGVDTAEVEFAIMVVGETECMSIAGVVKEEISLFMFPLAACIIKWDALLISTCNKRTQ
jgi:hypothetical protein